MILFQHDPGHRAGRMEEHQRPHPLLLALGLVFLVASSVISGYSGYLETMSGLATPS